MLNNIYNNLAFIFLLTIYSYAATSAEDITPEDIETQVSRWVSLERQGDTLRNNWRELQPILEQQLYLLEREQEELATLLKNTENLRDEVEQKRLQLVEEQGVLEQKQQLLERSLNRSIAELDLIYPQLPPPMFDAWGDNIQKLRGDLLSNSERLQTVVDMLTQLHEFQEKISLHETTMEFEDGRRYLVRQVFLGLSQGWYVSADGKHAGYGTASPQGWEWRSIENSEIVTRFIAILERKQAADFLTIPVTLATGIGSR